jgi:hypothetical protein
MRRNRYQSGPFYVISSAIKNALLKQRRPSLTQSRQTSHIYVQTRHYGEILSRSILLGIYSTSNLPLKKGKLPFFFNLSFFTLLQPKQIHRYAV